ncbi:MAG: DUF4422 domain-containing protein [Bifidobacterium sp.]|uniref:DUF4422 domain-containing protein n=1 Tax=Bifidobacterium fermentum TaxID=3059035 RepID=A0AB39UHL1_9BIFI
MVVAIAIATHKQYRMPHDSVYLPIQLGRGIAHNNFGFQMDDAGDNISAKNPHYSELTALYWLWKNSDADYKGLVHYRRHFGTRNIFVRLFSRDRFTKIVRGTEIKEILSNSQIILPKKRHYYVETIYSHYSHTFDGKQLDVTREILEKDFGKYVPAFDRVMSSTSAHLFNMFIMESHLVDDYCDFMFSVIGKLEEYIGYDDLNAFQSRYPGRISERLLDVWLLTNNYAYAELPVVSTEPVNWWKKGTSFIRAKLGGKGYDASF